MRAPHSEICCTSPSRAGAADHLGLALHVEARTTPPVRVGMAESARPCNPSRNDRLELFFDLA